MNETTFPITNILPDNGQTITSININGEKIFEINPDCSWKIAEVTTDYTDNPYTPHRLLVVGFRRKGGGRKLTNPDHMYCCDCVHFSPGKGFDAIMCNPCLDYFSKCSIKPRFVPKDSIQEDNQMLTTLTDFCEKCIYNNLEPTRFQEHHDPCTDCRYTATLMAHPTEYIPKDGKTWGSNPLANSTTSETDKVIQDPGFDPVSRPSHYTEGREYEPRKVIHDWEPNFNLGNAVKYISRAGRKGDALEDLKKARQYLDFEIEEMEKEKEKSKIYYDGYSERMVE